MTWKISFEKLLSAAQKVRPLLAARDCSQGWMRCPTCLFRWKKGDPENHSPRCLASVIDQFTDKPPKDIELSGVSRRRCVIMYEDGGMSDYTLPEDRPIIVDIDALKGMGERITSVRFMFDGKDVGAVILQNRSK